MSTSFVLFPNVPSSNKAPQPAGEIPATSAQHQVAQKTAKVPVLPPIPLPAESNCSLRLRALDLPRPKTPASQNDAYRVHRRFHKQPNPRRDLEVYQVANTRVIAFCERLRNSHRNQPKPTQITIFPSSSTQNS